MTTYIKWTAIFLTTLGTVYFINIARQPNVYQALTEALILLLAVIPLAILLNVFHSRLAKFSLTDKVQIGLTVVFLFIASLTIYYLVDLTLIKNDGWNYQRFKDLGTGDTGQFYLDKRIGYAGLILLTVSWLTTSLNLRKTNQKLIWATFPFLYHIALWTIIYFAYRTTPKLDSSFFG